jgi:hypothetical protein
MIFYRRILNIRWSLYVSMSIIVGYFVAVITTMSVACRPFSHFWEQYTDPRAEGVCIDVSQFFLVNGIAAVLIDVMILCVPAPVIWRLQMPKAQRLAVISILLLGGWWVYSSHTLTRHILISLRSIVSVSLVLSASSF